MVKNLRRVSLQANRLEHILHQCGTKGTFHLKFRGRIIWEFFFSNLLDITIVCIKYALSM